MERVDVQNYNKMNTSGTLTGPMLRSNLPPNVKVLCTQPAFKVKLQEKVNMYNSTLGQQPIEHLKLKAFIL
eukprot:4601167-Ditylum_brightwellii.AAC.1